MNKRKTLTKSLHTVTVVSRIAITFVDQTNGDITPTEACRAALRMLEMDDGWTRDDPTFAACVAKVKQLRRQE